MPPADQEPPDRPDYKVYRSRPGIFSRLRAPRMPKLERPGRRPGRRRDDRPAVHRTGGRSWKRIVVYGIGAWLVLSAAAFAVSSQIQKSKLPDSAGDELPINPLLIAEGHNVLVLGTDVRPEGSKEFEARVLGSPGCPNVAECSNTRADTLMVIHSGGGSFNKLSIPRDTQADIPGHGPDKINAAYALGGPALQIKTVEGLLGIDIDHVVIIDFTGFQELIDALGGVKVRLRQRVCAEISGGGKNGGVTLRLTGGEHTLNGRQALALARARKNTCASDFDDRDRAENQQRLLTGIKDRLTSPIRLPYNFIKGPIIGWAAPKTMISDMGPFVLPQFGASSVFAGDERPAILEPTGIGPNNTLVVPQAEIRKKVRRLLK